MYTLCIVICLNYQTINGLRQEASGPIMSTEVRANQKHQHLTWPRLDKYIQNRDFSFFHFFP